MKNILGNKEDLEFYNKEKVKVYEFYTYSDSRNSYEYTYDKNGMALTYKNGKPLTYKNSNGCWHKHTRDNEGNELTYKNSNGYWNKYTRDEKGNELTYEDSRGKKRGFDTPEFTTEELVKKLGDFKLIK